MTSILENVTEIDMLLVCRYVLMSVQVDSLLKLYYICAVLDQLAHLVSVTLFDICEEMFPLQSSVSFMFLLPEFHESECLQLNLDDVPKPN